MMMFPNGDVPNTPVEVLENMLPAAPNPAVLAPR